MSGLIVLYICAGLAALLFIRVTRKAIRNATPIDSDYDDFIGFQ